MDATRPYAPTDGPAAAVRPTPRQHDDAPRTRRRRTPQTLPHHFAHHLAALLAALLLCGGATARTLRFGVRAGFRAVDHRVDPACIDGMRIEAGGLRPGVEAGVLLRLDIARRFYLQTEASYTHTRCRLRFSGTTSGTATLHARRIEFPLLLGIRAGNVVRLFGGAAFRTRPLGRDSAPRGLYVRRGGRTTAITGGIGFDLGRFCLDLRCTGYPGARAWRSVAADRTSPPCTVRVRRDLSYGCSLAFLF